MDLSRQMACQRTTDDSVMLSVSYPVSHQQKKTAPNVTRVKEHRHPSTLDRKGGMKEEHSSEDFK